MGQIFSQINVTFSMSIDFITLAIHFVFPQTIPRLEIKMSDCC